MSGAHTERTWWVLCRRMKDRWTGLTDEDLQAISRDPELLLARIQDRQGITKEEAERELRLWLYQVEIEL